MLKTTASSTSNRPKGIQAHGWIYDVKIGDYIIHNNKKHGEGTYTLKDVGKYVGWKNGK